MKKTIIMNYLLRARILAFRRREIRESEKAMKKSAMQRERHKLYQKELDTGNVICENCRTPIQDGEQTNVSRNSATNKYRHERCVIYT